MENKQTHQTKKKISIQALQKLLCIEVVAIGFCLLIIVLLLVGAISITSPNPIVGSFLCSGLEGGAKSIYIKRVHLKNIRGWDSADEYKTVSVEDKFSYYSEIYHQCTLQVKGRE